MGEPVLIDEVARRLVADSERRVEIVYTGLREGEKLHEVLFSGGEVGRTLSHPRISHVGVPALPPGLLPVMAGRATDEDVIARIRKACATLPSEWAQAR